MLEEGSVVVDKKDQKWRVGREIGCGRCCRVYSVSNIKSDEQGAMKLYKEGLQYYTAYEKEWLLLNILKEKHGIIDNIVQVVGTSSYGNQPIIIEEYLKPSLQEIIFTAKQHGCLSLFVVHKIISDVISGISLLHKNGFVHGDIKPDNILWSTDLSCFKLIDFGLAFHLEDKMVGLVQSTQYRAPEVSTQSNIVPTSAIDIWSVGILLIYLITDEKFITHQKQHGYCVSCHSGSICSNISTVNNLFQRSVWHTDKLILETLKHIAIRCVQCKPEKRPTADEILNFLNSLHITDVSYFDLLLLPSTIIRLLNMVHENDVTDAEELDDIKADILEECKKYGDVDDCIIPTAGRGLGKVYVKFSSSTGSCEAFSKLNGRQFNDRTVLTTYYLSGYYKQGVFF